MRTYICMYVWARVTGQLNCITRILLFALSKRKRACCIIATANVTIFAFQQMAAERMLNFSHMPSTAALLFYAWKACLGISYLKLRLQVHASILHVFLCLYLYVCVCLSGSWLACISLSCLFIACLSMSISNATPWPGVCQFPLCRGHWCSRCRYTARMYLTCIACIWHKQGMHKTFTIALNAKPAFAPLMLDASLEVIYNQNRCSEFVMNGRMRSRLQIKLNFFESRSDMCRMRK